MKSRYQQQKNIFLPKLFNLKNQTQNFKLVGIKIINMQFQLQQT